LAKNRAESPQRAKRSSERRKAVRAVLAGEPVPADMVPAELGAHAARMASRQALTFARACFDQSLGDNAEALAAKMIELGLEGNPAVLLMIARTLQPPAKYDSTRVELDLGPLDTLDDIDRARRRLAEAVFSGKVGVEDSNHLARLLDSLGEAILRREKQALLAGMRDALADATQGAISARISSLTKRSEVILSGLGGGATPMIEAEFDGERVEVDDDTWRRFR
jgi:hypothetical protein